MRRIKISLAYDGTDFHGWQVQPGLPTIQGSLEKILTGIEDRPVKVAGSGRTDAGVHALAQVAAFSLENPIPVDNLRKAKPKHPPVMVGMSDRNEDDLNAISRKGYPDLLDAAFRGTNQAYYEAARPTADIVIPTLSEHTVGQLLQMFMLATVVEGRLVGTNPYGQPGVEAYKKNMTAILRATPNLPKGEVRDQTKGA